MRLMGEKVQMEGVCRGVIKDEKENRRQKSDSIKKKLSSN